MPIAVEHLSRKTRIVATEVLSSPFGAPAFHLKFTIAHALSIPSGGIPTIFVAEEETFVFEETEEIRVRSLIR